MTAPYYEADGITLYHGDCLDITEWLTADVLVTDPPYGVHMTSWTFHPDKNTPSIIGERRSGRSADRIITDDDVAPRNSAMAAWGCERPAVVFGSWRAPRPPKTLMRLVWDKSPFGIGGVGIWRMADEEIYLCNSWPNDKGSDSPDTSVIRMAREPLHDRQHPTPKPLRLMEYLIQASPPGTIADPFAGSGSTLIAARNLGRHAIGVELEERYCELIARRLAQGALFTT